MEKKGLMDMENRLVTEGEKGYKGAKWKWKNTIKINKQTLKSFFNNRSFRSFRGRFSAIYLKHLFLT